LFCMVVPGDERGEASNRNLWLQGRVTLRMGQARAAEMMQKLFKC
jgi:hypothetical protein